MFYIYRMTDTNLSKSKRSGALDLFRFLAIVAVYFGHFADTFNLTYNIVPENLSYNPVVKYFDPALMVFFMVSAFVVTMSTMKRSLKDFFVIRVSRLYPLYWISCIAAFFLSRFAAEHTYLARLPLKAFIANLTMFPGVFGFPFLNPVFHTMAIELCFYVFIMFILGFKLWNKILVIFTIVLVLCYINYFLAPAVQLYTLAAYFMGGMLFYFIFSKKYTQWKVYVLLAFNFSLSLLSCQATAAARSASYQQFNIVVNPWILVIIVTVIYLLFLLISLRKLNIPGYLLFQRLGEITYPFYLSHLYFLGIYWYFRNTIQPDLLLIFILILVLITAWTINVTIEKPLSRFATYIITTVANLFDKKAFGKKNESVTHDF